MDSDVRTKRKADIKVFGRVGEEMEWWRSERERGEKSLAIS